MVIVQPMRQGLEAELHSSRREIARLTSENNLLHKQLIASADVHDQHARKTSMVIRQLEEELQDLRFLNSQHTLAIQKEHRRLDNERRRVEDLVKKWHLLENLKSSDTRLPIANQHIDLPHGPLPQMDPVYISNHVSGLNHAHIVDMVKLAELSTRQQRDRAEDAERRIHELELHCNELKSQLHTRETEIHRLSSFVESEHQPNAMPQREHLEAQIDYLQQSVKDLETKLAISQSRGSDDLRKALEKNSQLESSLESIQNELKKLRSAYEGQETNLDANRDEREVLNTLLRTAREEHARLVQKCEALEAQLLQHTVASPKTTNLCTPSIHPTIQQVNQAIQTVVDDNGVSSIHQQAPKNDALRNEIEQERVARSKLVEELRQLNGMTLTLSREVEQVVAERNNFESLYLQASDKLLTSTDNIEESKCSDCFSLMASLQARTAELHQCRSDLSDLSCQLKDLEAQTTKYRQELCVTNDVKQHNSTLQATQMELTRTLGEQARVIQQLNDNLAEARLKAASASRLKDAEVQSRQLEKDLVATKASAVAIQSSLDQRVLEVNQLHLRIQELETENKTLSIEVNNVASDLSTLIRENQRLCHEMKSLSTSQAVDTKTIEELRLSIQTHRDALRQAKNEQKELVTNYTRLISQFEARGNAVASLQVSISQLRQELRMKDARIFHLQTGSQTQPANHEPNHLTNEKPTRETSHDIQIPSKPEPLTPIGTDGSLTREWEAEKQDLANYPSILRRKRLLDHKK